MSQQLTLVDKLRQRAQEQGQSPAFIFRSRDQSHHVLTWNSLYRLAGRFAAVLNSRGVGRGHLVVNTLLNSSERVVCEVGIWMSGAAFVNAHCQMADGSELLRTIRVSRASAVLVDPDISTNPWYVLKKTRLCGRGGQRHIFCANRFKAITFHRRVAEGNLEDFITGLEAQNDWFQANDVKSEDILTVFTTSGTTGFSKLVVYTHYDYIHPISSYSTLADKLQNMFKSAPLDWLGGYVGASAVVCHTSVLCDVRGGEAPDDMPEFIWKTVKEEKCNSAILTPTYLPRLVQVAKQSHEKSDAMCNSQPSELSKLNFIILFGLPINREMIRAALFLAHTTIVSYGATDFSEVATNVVTDSETYVNHDAGPPKEGMSVKIVSQDDEDIVLPVNQVGNILVKRSVRNRGYLSDPDVTKDDFLTKDGFFRTQDVGRLDERGHLIVDGRGSDAIMRGPYIFYPTWMESRIKICPGVRDVIITGIPDPFINEELCACVVLDSDSVTLEQVRHLLDKDVVTSENDLLSPRLRYYLEFESFPHD